MAKKQKLVLAWVDRTGFELTGGYRDALRHYPETRATLEPKAASWGENTPENLERLKHHVEKDKSDYLWMGFFLLDYTNDMLGTARDLALKASKAAGVRS